MSSAETTLKTCAGCGDGDLLRQEVAKLKCDKLDLLRQNVVRGFMIPQLRHNYMNFTFRHAKGI